LPHAWVTVLSFPIRENGFPQNNIIEFSSWSVIWNFPFGIQSWTTTVLSKLPTRKLTLREEETSVLQSQKEKLDCVDTLMIILMMIFHQPWTNIKLMSTLNIQEVDVVLKFIATMLVLKIHLLLLVMLWHLSVNLQELLPPSQLLMRNGLTPSKPRETPDGRAMFISRLLRTPKSQLNSITSLSLMMELRTMLLATPPLLPAIFKMLLLLPKKKRCSCHAWWEQWRANSWRCKLKLKEPRNA